MEQSLTTTSGGIAMSVALKIDVVTSSRIVVDYAGLHGNMPMSYNNSIVIFPSDGSGFPYNSSLQPLVNFPIQSNASAGTVVIPASLSPDTPYVVSYAVGPVLKSPAQAYGNVAAVQWIPASGQNHSGQKSILSLTYVSPTVTAVMYSLVEGMLPASNGAWIGLWIGSSPSYITRPMAVRPITTDSASGTATINIPVMRGTIYSLGLFASGYASTSLVQTAMVATCTFNT